MALLVKHNRADHTHENEQFRRVAINLKHLFLQQDWSGILIGNPFNEDYSRFRADAILLYDHGLMIIDFKSYSGRIVLPEHDKFKSDPWFAESDEDKSRISIKGGSFLNPFKQLHSYREAFREIVDNELSLSGEIYQSRTCVLNIFSGPVTCNHKVPGDIPYYKICDENNLGNVLYDYTSKNSYSNELGNALSKVFDAKDWDEHIQMPSTRVEIERVIEIEKDVEKSIEKFLRTEGSGILVLESMHSELRDDWAKFIVSQSVDFKIPQTEMWVHSARIARKVSARIGIDLQSVYNTIYGGNTKANKKADADQESEETDGTEEQQQEQVPIRTDDSIDESAVVILHEAHLVSRSLHQSELLRFGSGRLLEDLFQFLNLKETNRKLICIGDPYSLSYGKDTDSALNIETLSQNYDGDLTHFRQPLESGKTIGKQGLLNELATGIELDKFSNLIYPWSENDLEEVTKDTIPKYLMKWFSTPIESEPSNGVMVYSKKDASTINNWVKNNCLKNGEDLSVNDLLLISNNVTIPDDSGFQRPTKLYNGMYLLVKDIGQTTVKQISIRQSNNPIKLSFTRITVRCLSISASPETEVYLLDNYFVNDAGLTKEEQIAFRVFVNNLVNELIKANSFETSEEYRLMEQEAPYQEIDSEVLDLKKKLKEGERVRTELDRKEIAQRKFKSGYKKKHRRRILSQVIKTDPFVNAVHAKYGWALTVHKAIGSKFSNAIINAYQGENRGIRNAEYFRWLYSASVSAVQNLWVANPQEINPLTETLFENNLESSAPKERPQKSSLILFSEYNIPERFITIVSNGLKPSVSGTICELTKILDGSGISLTRTLPLGDYLTKATYSEIDSGKKFVLAIDNKGAKSSYGVSSIRIDTNDGVAVEKIEKGIEEFRQLKNPTDTAGFDFPTDFRYPIYQKWSSTLASNELSFDLLEQHKHQDIFRISDDAGKVAVIRVWYGDDGFFRKVVVLEKSEDQLGEDIENWLLHGD
jgi:hypothetical protein